jgi:hypothetical protein
MSIPSDHMHTKRRTRSRRLAAAIAAGALMLVTASAAVADGALVSDPDEPGVPAERDLAWASVGHPPSVSGRIVRHTIKTMAPYARRPCLGIVTSVGSYAMCGPLVATPGGGSTTVGVSETPAGAPDTVSYTFNLSQIGDPVSYLWNVSTRPIQDYLPDKPARIVHSVDAIPIAEAERAFG